MNHTPESTTSNFFAVASYLAEDNFVAYPEYINGLINDYHFWAMYNGKNFMKPDTITAKVLVKAAEECGVEFPYGKKAKVVSELEEFGELLDFVSNVRTLQGLTKSEWTRVRNLNRQALTDYRDAKRARFQQ